MQRLLCLFNPAAEPCYVDTANLGIERFHLTDDFPLRRYGATDELPAFGVVLAKLAH